MSKITTITIKSSYGICYDNDTMDELIDNIRKSIDHGDRILITRPSLFAMLRRRFLEIFGMKRAET